MQLIPEADSYSASWATVIPIAKGVDRDGLPSTEVRDGFKFH